MVGLHWWRAGDWASRLCRACHKEQRRIYDKKSGGEWVNK